MVSYTPKHRNCNRNFRIIKSAVGCEASTLAKSAPENNLGVYVLLAASPIGYSFPLDGLSIWAAQLKDSHRSLAVVPSSRWRVSRQLRILQSRDKSIKLSFSRQGPPYSTHLAQLLLCVCCFQPWSIITARWLTPSPGFWQIVQFSLPSPPCVPKLFITLAKLSFWPLGR